MSEDSKHFKRIEEDRDCCEIWPKIAGRFNWMYYGRQPDMLTLPYIRDGETSWRVNYCPACGKPAANRNMSKARIRR